MNDAKHKHSSEQPTTRREMSRRQFLSYALGGTTAFMAAGVTIPMIRFAVDPILQPTGAGDFVKVVEESKITNEPKSFKFQIHQVDGWYESDIELEAWIMKDEKGAVYALSPVCKHLGCTVNWNADTRYPNQFFCPCHEAHYTKEGKNLAVAPLPLDEYKIKIESGFVYLGKVQPNQHVTK
ncbi:ubiquinol-cytochrome c reductase iron-sulfur subunit [Paenibacillus ginsengarvi]|uniref:Menaquinol:cytochrome c reductase iron-sulfur subunit n=1 Tax=Paenibacillus ginsengarvi TaxID=400777 RepID=A0A3B0BGE5_9BACL|nr:ubiquinol-cytochrome c reductase iron-sulfur subunit [Paenibacillus ginsengarvi]RKN72453.1 ubiquinol-cytochrome c reductase iron-sulfur subunit [Paenibacillus ginsengarvi]